MNAENSQNQHSQSGPRISGTNQIAQSQCDEILPAIPAHSIGATDAAEAAKINARLASCPNAAAELAAYEQIAERLLYGSPAAAPSPVVERRLRAAIAASTMREPSNAAVSSAPAASPSPSRAPFLQQRRRAITAPVQASGSTALPMPSRRQRPFAPKRPAVQRNPHSTGPKKTEPALPSALAMYRLESGQPEKIALPVGQRPPVQHASSINNPWHFGRFLATAAVLALVFFNLALLNQNQQLQHQQSTIASNLAQQNQALILLAAEEPQEIEIFAPDGSSAAKADILWNNDLNIAVVYVRNFPVCEPGMNYQLWLTRDGQRISGGLFSVDSRGMGLLVIPLENSLDIYDTIGITREPNGGSPGPTSPPVVRGEL